jgi:hypothetical protein
MKDLNHVPSLLALIGNGVCINNSRDPQGPTRTHMTTPWKVLQCPNQERFFSVTPFPTACLDLVRNVYLSVENLGNPVQTLQLYTGSTKIGMEI